MILLIKKSWVGNILDTLRNDEILLSSMGMSPMLWKIYAFSIGILLLQHLEVICESSWTYCSGKF